MEPYQPPFDPSGAVQLEKHEIRLLGALSGGAILLYVLLQNVLVGALALVGQFNNYRTHPLLQAGVDILLTIGCLLLPFLLLGRPMARISRTRDALPLEAPRSGGDFFLAIPAGVGFCILANLVSSYIIRLISAFGLELSSPDLPLPDGALGVTVSFFRVVVVAAMVEELCFRGVVMGNLRRYGDFFAVFMASLVFALMHCNLIQAPFALIVGFALGYLCIRTGSLWTAVAVHALNNTISLVFSYLLERYDETAVNLAYTVLIDALMAAGAICLCVLLFRRRKRPALSRTTRGFWRKTFWFFCNPPMLVALGLMIWFTMRYVGPAG